MKSVYLKGPIGLDAQIALWLKRRLNFSERKLAINFLIAIIFYMLHNIFCQLFIMPTFALPGGE
jgi:hypothetical protein